MLPRLMLVSLFAVALAVSSSGCCLDGCGVRGPMGRHLPGPIDCECAGAGCGACGQPFMGPLRYLRYRATCGAGCGDMYFDEWASDPPDCKDPCPDGYCGPMCGVGCGGGCGRPIANGVRALAERRYWPGRSYGGFDPGAGRMSYADGEVVHQGEWIESGPAPSAAPTPGPTPAARQTQSAIKPTGSRQPYYEPAHSHSHPHSQPNAASRHASGFRTAANPYPMSGRMVR